MLLYRCYAVNMREDASSQRAKSVRKIDDAHRLLCLEKRNTYDGREPFGSLV